MRSIGIALLASWLIAGGPRAFAQPPAAVDDGQIRAEVEHRLRDKGIAGVTIDVHDARVTLTGTVPSLWAKSEAIDQARKADDVASVVSELSIARAERDDDVAQAIRSKLVRYVFYTIFDDVNVGVDGGHVLLTGRVTMPYKAQEMENLASRVYGVQSIENRMETLPTSMFDDQLRYTIAAQIYRDPLFWNYAIQANPPIHIVVEHGRVTLSGVVISEVERRTAESIARSTFGAMSVENQLRLESEVGSRR